MSSFAVILFCTLLLLPYTLIFYKKYSIRIRLVFISIIEILLLVYSLIFAHFAELDSMLAFMFAYNIVVWITVAVNVILIIISWAFMKRVNR
jgi:hypothetical protein